MFDPSDVDGCMRLAEISIRLARLALKTIERDKQGLHMGRDESNELSVAAREILERTDNLEDRGWASR